MQCLKRLIWLSVVLCISSLNGMAQRPVLNNTSSGIRWNQVITPSFRVVFPNGHQQHALRVANTLEGLHQKEARTLSATLPKRISIILQDFNAFSNGFIAFGPRRGEFFTTPPQNPELAGTNDWLDLLSVHEYRHVVQYHHSRQGFTRLMYYLFGQQTQSGTAFSAVPRWFWEGDATLSETLYSPSGRGRIPAFGRVFKANLLEGKKFTYNKQHLRSYRDFVPDHYKLGYYFVTHLRRRTGDPDIWQDVTSDAFKWSFVPFTFSNSLKKNTGYHLLPNYQLMMDELQATWRQEQSQKEITEVEDVTGRDETVFTDYKYPVFTSEGNVIAMRSGIGDIAQFVSIDEEGKAKVIYTPGIMNDAGMLSLENDLLVWNEFHYDPRWRQKTYSVIKTYDLKSGTKKTLTSKTRYNGASLSPDGSKVVTTLNTTTYENYLVVLDSRDGTVLNRLPNPDQGLYAMARWSDDGRGIVALKTISTGKGIIFLDYTNGQESWLLAPSSENIGYPVLRGDYLYFNSPYGGTDNIHVLHLPSGRRFQVTESRYGAYNPVVSPQGDYLLYNDHRVNGLDVVRIPLDTAQWKPLLADIGDEVFYFEPLKAQEEDLNLLDSIPDNKYPIRPYRRLPRLFNPHSWGLEASTNLNQVQVGISSQDIMSTMNVGLGYIYDQTEGTGYGFAQVSYQGLYPIIDGTVEYGSRKSDRGTIEGEPLIYDWNETSFIGGIRLPLILTRSKWVSELTIQERVGVTKISEFTSSINQFALTPDKQFQERLVRLPGDTLYVFLDDELSNGDIVFNNVNLFYYALLKQSSRDIASRYGAVLNLRYLSTPFGGDFNGEVFGASGVFYLPSPLLATGIPAFKHHSVALRAGYQYQPDDFSEDFYRFRNQIPLPRGYSYPDFATFTYLGAEYAFPAWYPDIGIGPLFYFKRLRAKGFYDYGTGNRTRYFYNGLTRELRGVLLDYTYESAGVELLMDMHVMRFAQEIGIGVRYSRLLTTSSNAFYLLLNIEF